jgi:predicted naringenin-chalcone synthase
MSAPGLDLQVMELMDLEKNIFRTSINFMGCYAAIHALKLADALCKSDTNAKVLIVCTEICTLHFQREATIDNMTSSLLFGDGCAAVLICNNNTDRGIEISSFHSEVIPKGKRDMAWELSSSGFLMTLSGYVPELIEEDFSAVVSKALAHSEIKLGDIHHWCIHPGGKKILEAIEHSVGITKENLKLSYDVLANYGNMSSATILFVLKEIMHRKQAGQNIFASAFGPGLSVETFTAIS